jgi:transcriptional regulator with XRE-family HTH domain
MEATLMAPETTIQERVLKARMVRGLTQAGLGQVLGKDPAQMSKIERGCHRPRPGTLLKIAQALRVNMQWLAFGEGPMDVQGSESSTASHPERLEA